ncbi:hypothetical protein DO70_4636 [Burkholderia pseudomallei]|nr:hypothetical protein DO70_4636 [Burkholderia pseudomallei]
MRARARARAKEAKKAKKAKKAKARGELQAARDARRRSAALGRIAVEVLDQFLHQITMMRRQRFDLRRQLDRFLRRRVFLVASRRRGRFAAGRAGRRPVMEPVQVDAQPVGERAQLVGRRNRAARQPFMRGLR